MSFVVFFVILFLVWLVLTFSLALPSVVVGLLASLLTTLLFGRYFVKDVKKFFQPQRYFWGAAYLFVFAWECVKANFDVAYRVLHPARPIKPGIVRVKTSLETDIARVMLANSITMTPGTITVDIIGDSLYIHWIYVSSTDPGIYTRKVSGRFEKFIKRIFE